jgi:predicted transcriptional regulator
MPNITLKVDDEVIRKVRKIAVDRDTTLTQMIRDYLQAVAEGQAKQKNRTIRELKRSFSELSRDMGKRTWKREGLYER